MTDVFGFTFAHWEKELLETAFELLVKQERRHLPEGNITKVAESMLAVIRNAKPNTESLFSLTFADEGVN
jgi:hypothetical protein